MTTTKEILISARKLISDEKNWTQKAFARDENKDPVAPVSLSAVCFCSIGALRRAEMENLNKKANPLRISSLALKALSLELKGHSHIYQFNDTSTHQEVLALFDRAIANCQ